MEHLLCEWLFASLGLKVCSPWRQFECKLDLCHNSEKGVIYELSSPKGTFPDSDIYLQCSNLSIYNWMVASIEQLIQLGKDLGYIWRVAAKKCKKSDA